VPSSDPVQRFEDILNNIGRIEDYTAGMSGAAFLEDNKTYDAVERCLERISEAAKNSVLSRKSLARVSRGPEIRGLGNFLRHEYDRIESERLWVMIERDLPPLKVAVRSALDRL
jgi:uncharacterized protein with HEPN domain